MTDGIIQQVLNRHKIDLAQFIMLWKISPQEYNQELDSIKQELIEKIKQFNFDWLEVTGKTTKIIPKEYLIGDNQE